MKKFFALVLVLVMMFALAVPAFAETVDQMGDAAQIPVTGVYNRVDNTNVYSVDISWTSMQFTYTETNTWVPAENGGSYQPNGDGQWSIADDGGKITVTNKSNKAIVAAMSFTPTSQYENIITGSFDNATLNLAAAQSGNTSGSAKLTIACLLGKTFTESESGATLGNVTVNLSDPSANP